MKQYCFVYVWVSFFDITVAAVEEEGEVVIRVHPQLLFQHLYQQVYIYTVYIYV